MFYVFLLCLNLPATILTPAKRLYEFGFRLLASSYAELCAIIHSFVRMPLMLNAQA